MKKLWILILLCFLCGCRMPSTEVQTSAPETAVTVTAAPEETTAPAETEEAPQPEEQETTPKGFDAYVMAQSLSLEEQVGQLFLAVCPDSQAAEDAASYHLGGYLLFGKDFAQETPDSVREKIASYQAAAEIPLLIAVDEEGGTVTRVSRYKAFRESSFPSPRTLYAQGGLEAVLQAEEEKNVLLSSLGINVNLAPVCDITTNSASFMYSRSLGQDPLETGAFVAAVTEVMEKYQIGGVLKHFPGYGNNTDTHVGIAVDNRSLEELEERDLIPFQFGIDAGCDAIMVSHTFVNAMDPGYPASLSPAVHDYLRGPMGFDGVIVTDDLGMGAITDLYGPGEAAVLAVRAGNDLLITSCYRVQYEAVLQAVLDGRISREQLTEAVTRILQWKYDLGLITE